MFGVPRFTRLTRLNISTMATLKLEDGYVKRRQFGTDTLFLPSVPKYSSLKVSPWGVSTSSPTLLFVATGSKPAEVRRGGLTAKDPRTPKRSGMLFPLEAAVKVIPLKLR